MKSNTLHLECVVITHETSAAKTPQQKGVIERKNRTLVEAARTILIFSHAPLFLWAEAIATACYTQNRSIIHQHFKKTPYELIQGRKSDISYLHVFWALCYPKNDCEDIGKLGATGDICFFIGYSTNSISYRVYTRRTKKIMETMKVKFDELLAMAFEQNSSRPVAQMEAIRILLAYATHKGFTLYQMDVKTAFLHGSLKEDVYVCQPEGFINADYRSHVYKLKKALYGLKQVPRAWYDELSTFLLQNDFSQGHSVSYGRENCISAWFIERRRVRIRFDDDILVVQVYVDDNIFGSTNPRYATLFSDLMKSRFEMSMMGKITFFLGLQVNQFLSDIFINQANYVYEILKKYGLNTSDIISTLMDIKDKLDLDHIGTPVDATKYHSMIGALMYLTSSRPDIVHATCVCARYQAHPIEKHLKEVKRIFRYLRGTINMGLCYMKDSGFELAEFLDVDYAGCKDTFKITSGGAKFLGKKI
nr:copia protein [Tanacetum cinerariifolium]